MRWVDVGAEWERARLRAWSLVVSTQLMRALLLWYSTLGKSEACSMHNRVWVGSAQVVVWNDLCVVTRLQRCTNSDESSDLVLTWFTFSQSNKVLFR